MRRFNESYWQARAIEVEYELIYRLNPHPVRTAILDALVMDVMKIDHTERHDMVANGETSQIKKRLAWGRIALRSAGYIESPKRCWWKLSEFGVTQPRVLGGEILKTALSLSRGLR